MAATGTTASAEKGRRIVGAERQTLAKDLVKRYTSGESFRALASSTGRSYGFVHRVLTESGVRLRQRGGARRRKKACPAGLPTAPARAVDRTLAGAGSAGVASDRTLAGAGSAGVAS